MTSDEKEDLPVADEDHATEHDGYPSLLIKLLVTRPNLGIPKEAEFMFMSTRRLPKE